MRRKEKEIAAKADLESILEKAAVCRLGMAADGEPYVVPLCFGYRDGALFFHSASRGRKVEILGRNPRVCFEVDIDAKIVRGAGACDWGMRYQSVVGFGTAVEITDPDEKRAALDVIMAHYAEAGESFQYPQSGLRKTTVFRVDVRRMTGKRS